MLSFKNTDVYDETANYIFNLSPSNELDLNKLTILFQKNGFEKPHESIIESLKTYYNNKKLTKQNVKPVDLNATYKEILLEENLKSMYKDDKNNLNSILLKKDLQELDSSIDFSLFDNFLEDEVKINNNEINNIDNFYLYIKNNFFIEK